LYQWCYGLWPSSGQSSYQNGCYGHDEPGIEPYSDLPGSEGNVTWNVTLPTDVSQTLNQSNLYAAIWFGMTLNDPFAWMGQCFLELQFYPDSSWNNPALSINGSWAGAAVAWQIDNSNGTEDPCFYLPLFNYTNTWGSGQWFQMHGGDQVRVSMTGWNGSVTGERIVVDDMTAGVSSILHLVSNYAPGEEGVPLDPSYSSNIWQNALQWTPGGELPTAFAFETGHCGWAGYAQNNPLCPENNSYYGCSPGVPPSTSGNPSVPCPGYDPGSWVNDTYTPWLIAPPFFNNSASHATASQVGYAQDFGGPDLIGQLSNGKCSGIEGSAYCSYPWFSYSCAAHAYSFGATDWPGVAKDFSTYGEYDTTSKANALGLGFFPPTNASVPNCGSTAYSVAVTAAGTGTVAILGQTISTSATISGLLPGSYEVLATPGTGMHFAGWSISAGGGIYVDSAGEPWTTVHITGGSGLTLTATFTAAAPPTTKLYFNDSAGNGQIVFNAGLYYDGPNYGSSPSLVETNGLFLNLAPGIYSVQALPNSAFNFSGWSASGLIDAVASPAFPMTWVQVSGGGHATITAHYTPSKAQAVVDLLVQGGGTITFNGVTYDAPSTLLYVPTVSLPTGTYTLMATANASYTFRWWYYSDNAVLGDFNPSTWINVEENGTCLAASGPTCALFGTLIIANFEQSPVVTLDTLSGVSSPGGGIVWDDQNYVASGNTVTLSDVTPPAKTVFGQTNFTIGAVLPLGGVSTYTFSSWTVSNAAMLWVNHACTTQSICTVQVNGTGTLTANLVATLTTYAVVLSDSPTAGGAFWFDGTNYTSGTTVNVGAGTYVGITYPNTYFRLSGATTTGGVTFPIGFGPIPFYHLNVSWIMFQVTVSASGALTLHWGSVPVKVTFVASPPELVSSASVNSIPVSTDLSVWVAEGTSVPIAAVLNHLAYTFQGWNSTPKLVVASPTTVNTSLLVLGSGTIYLVASSDVPVAPVRVAVSPNPVVVWTNAAAAIVNAAVTCTSTCPSGTYVSWGWSSTTATVSPSLASASITPGGTPGSFSLWANATVPPYTVSSGVVPVTIAGITSVAVSRSATSIGGGSSVYLNATPSCNVATCAGGSTYSWGISPGTLGALNATTGSAVLFTSTWTSGSVTFWSNATLDGVTVHSSAVSVQVLANVLQGLTASPTTSTMGAGTSVALTTSESCTTSPCPSGTTYAWLLSPTSLGSLTTSTSAPGTATFTAGSAGGWGNITVSATLHGTTASATVPVEVVAVTAVAATPSAVVLTVGGSQVLNASVMCAPSCPSAATFTWHLPSGAPGSLSATSGSMITYSAGSSAGFGNLTLNASLLGTAGTTQVPLQVLVELSGLTVSPGTASVQTGATQAFSVTPQCSGGSCPSWVAYQWSVSPTDMGTLSSSSGTTVVFTAGSSSGTVTVTVTGILNGKTVSSSPATITINKAPSKTPGPLSGGLASPYVLLPILAAIIVAVLLLLLYMRRRKKGPSEAAAKESTSTLPPWEGEKKEEAPEAKKGLSESWDEDSNSQPTGGRLDHLAPTGRLEWKEEEDHPARDVTPKK
ncbi:MAG: Ig-like domain-containing protein, partial [Euryarchaeota archaeon]|nr:Ig-like domain-containing protein [Euryarchaeota archaeon]